jgi:hypothetical protein
MQSSFQRTAKYCLGDGQALSRAKAAIYKRNAGWLPYCELTVGTFFLGTVLYGIDSRNLLTVPFLCIFVMGYYYTGFMTLLQDRMGATRELLAGLQARRLLSILTQVLTGQVR